MNLTDEIAEDESYSLEFKLIPNEERIKCLKTGVAFVNGKGGRLLFGFANDGTVHGIARDKLFDGKDGEAASRKFIADILGRKTKQDHLGVNKDGYSQVLTTRGTSVIMGANVVEGLIGAYAKKGEFLRAVTSSKRCPVKYKDSIVPDNVEVIVLHASSSIHYFRVSGEPVIVNADDIMNHLGSEFEGIELPDSDKYYVWNGEVMRTR